MAITRIDVDSFLKAIGEFYGDKIAPSLTTAYLPDKEVFYASLIRYSPYNSGSSKTVVLKVTSPTSTAAAVLKLMTLWKKEVLPPQKANLDAWLSTELPPIPTND